MEVSSICHYSLENVNRSFGWFLPKSLEDFSFLQIATEAGRDRKMGMADWGRVTTLTNTKPLFISRPKGSLQEPFPPLRMENLAVR